MMHDQFRGVEDWHPMGCRCAICGEPGPADRRGRLSPANMVAIVAIAGFTVGLVLCWALDAAIGGPGIGVMFQ